MKQTKKFKGGINGGMLYLILIMLMLGVISFQLVGGKLPITKESNPSKQQQVIIDSFVSDKEKNNLQLYTFLGSTPTPAPVIAGPHACVRSALNEEREFFLGSDPPPGQVSTNGLIRVWGYDDDAPPWVAPGTKTDPATGRITVPGDYTLRDSRPGKYIYHPGLYLTPITASNPDDRSGDAENGGKPHFPDLIKGEYTYAPRKKSSEIIKSAPLDDYLNFMNGPETITPRMIAEGFLAEFIWEIDKLGLSKGSYRAQFVMHDGDGDMSIDCITIQI